MGDDAVVGRQAELARLTRWLDDLDGSGGRVVLIRGEAGIGKSTLVKAFVAKASPRVRVFLGMCDPLGTPQPLGPVRDVARRSASVAAALDVGDRRSVMDALLDLLSHPTQAAVLVIEDVQWADEATFDVVRFLGRRIAAANGLLVLTYRDNEVDDDHPMRQIVGELPPANLARIAVPPLPVDAIASLAGDAPLAPSELLAFTGGNALFVSEVVAAGALEAPAAVEEVVLASVSRLSRDARRVAEFVSVNPAGVEWPVVDALLGPVTAELRAGVGRGLLRVDDEGVRYRHEIQRRAVEASLSAHRRRELHQRVLTHLDGRADVARLVHHARAAGDDDALMRFGPQAARAARVAGSHREAIAHFRAIGPLLDRLPDKEAASLAEDWVRTAHRFGYPDDAVAVLPRAVARWRSAGDRVALARTLALGVMVLENDARPGEADAAAAEAIEILEHQPAGSTLAYALTERARLHHLLDGDDEAHAIAALDRAIGIAEAAGDDRIAADALTLKGILLHNARDPHGIPLIERAYARAAGGGHRFEETEALLALAGKTADVRDLHRAIDLVERARATAARYELRPFEIIARVMRAEMLLWTGHWVSAEDEASEVLGMRAETDVIATRILATIATRRGATAADTTVRQAWELAQQWDELHVLDPAAGVVAEHLWLTDDHDQDLLAELDRVLERGVAGGSAWPSGTFAFWMWKLGRVSTAPASMPDLYRWIIEGESDRAAAFWGAQGATYDRAVALLHGDDAQALEALRIVEDLTADGTARRFRRVLRRRGLHAPRGSSRASRAHPAGLTARQAEVMQLLADGLSNVEIADTLFVSHRTVENHVAAILRKLDVTSRHAAVETARSQGLLDIG